jgi:hypothetical protein
VGHIGCHPKTRQAVSCQLCTHSASRRHYHEVGPHTTCTLQLIPSLRHVWHSRRQQQHVLWILGAFGLTNRGSRGITGMVGERSTQTDDAVTIRSTGERPLAAPTTRCSSILGVATATAFLAVRTQRAQQASTQMQFPVATRYRGHPRATTPTSGWNCSLYSHRRAYAHPDRRRHTWGATALRLADGWLLPPCHTSCLLPVRAPSTSTSALCYRPLLG